MNLFLIPSAKCITRITSKGELYHLHLEYKAQSLCVCPLEKEKYKVSCHSARADVQIST